jgi:hypothetical protein
MSEDDLELLVTIDDPGEAQAEDTFKHLQANNTLEYWLGQLFLARGWHDQQAEAFSNDDSYKMAFGQGDWTCTISTLTGTTIDPTKKKFDIEVCTVTHWQSGEIVEQKVFYDLVGIQRQMGLFH